MKEHPILFNAEMVRAVLDGRKTVTRRVCKDQTPFAYKHVENAPCVPSGGTYTGWIKSIQNLAIDVPAKCPYGSPGDRLWVRETFSFDWLNEGTPPSQVYHSAPRWYWADGNPEDGDWTRPKPSIHMPRWASRILLEVVSVRVERVQEITLKDICAEGLAETIYDFKPVTAGLKAWEILWDSINAKRGYGWESNPWVWVVEFKRVEG